VELIQRNNESLFSAPLNLYCMRLPRYCLECECGYLAALARCERCKAGLEFLTVVRSRGVADMRERLGARINARKIGA
jgi:hypothetical protein